MQAAGQAVGIQTVRFMLQASAGVEDILDQVHMLVYKYVRMFFIVNERQF